MTRHPLTIAFVDSVSQNVHRMCRQVIEAEDEAGSMDMLGEAFVLYLELAIFATLPAATEELRGHAKPLAKQAKEHLMVAAGGIAIDRLYQMSVTDE